MYWIRAHLWLADLAIIFLLHRSFAAPPAPLPDDRTFVIERHAMEQVLTSPSSARIVPVFGEERMVGFKVFAIRPGSLFDRLGLRNGDTLRSINGRALTSPDRALEIYSQVKPADHVELAIQRRGRDLTLRYEIIG
jgi:general secretion pathway protein C